MSHAAPRFHDLTVSRIHPEAAGSVAVSLHIPPELRETFAFEPGQFLTLRTSIGGQDVRRSYSISSPRSLLTQQGELTLGIRPVEGGVFSNWAATDLQAGDTLRVMPPDGRFTVHKPRAIHRVGFAAGSGITPILSIMASGPQMNTSSMLPTGSNAAMMARTLSPSMRPSSSGTSCAWRESTWISVRRPG
jgi:ring-1,2-phenylacetyl-CoA epoxidase subunit PaaE